MTFLKWIVKHSHFLLLKLLGISYVILYSIYIFFNLDWWQKILLNCMHQLHFDILNIIQSIVHSTSHKPHPQNNWIVVDVNGYNWIWLDSDIPICDTKIIKNRTGGLQRWNTPSSLAMISNCHNDCTNCPLLYRTEIYYDTRCPYPLSAMWKML